MFAQAVAPDGFSHVVCQSDTAVLAALSLTAPIPLALTYALEPAANTARGVVSVASANEEARAMSKYLLLVFVGLPLQAKLLHSSSRNRHAVAPVVGSVGWIAYLKFTLVLGQALRAGCGGLHRPGRVDDAEAVVGGVDGCLREHHAAVRVQIVLRPGGAGLAKTRKAELGRVSGLRQRGEGDEGGHRREE